MRSTGRFLREQGQMQVPVAGYSETRDNGGLQWRVTATPATKAPVAGYYETEVVNCMNSKSIRFEAAVLALLYRCCYYHYHHGHHPYQSVSKFFKTLKATSKFKPP